MAKKTRIWAVIFLVAKITIVVLTVISIAQFFIAGSQGNMKDAGFTCFRYYTILSNVFSALYALVTIPAHIKELVTGERCLAKWTGLVDMASANVITITLLVCVFFLGFIYGYPALFGGVNLFLHLITPLLALGIFLFEKNEFRIPFSFCFVCTVPTFIYGLVYFFQVLIAPKLGLAGWPDFYAFNAVGLWYVFAVVIIGGAFGLAVLLRLIKNKA